jgi:hypothetical protein
MQRGCSVASYRFYTLGSDDHIKSGEYHDRADDLDALEHAKALANDSPIEIWDGSRLVARVKPSGDGLILEDRPNPERATASLVGE